MTRSTKAGASTPATPHDFPPPERLGVRSTKAGASTPATRARVPLVDLADLRSTKAGASTPATLLVRHDVLRDRERSTKAGASTPATPWPSRGAKHRRRTLNEGRGVNPGDTRTTFPTESTSSVAQRRPGRQPRRHMRRSWACQFFRDAQRRPGRQPRRHDQEVIDWLARVLAQRRPGRQPRRHRERRWRPRATRDPLNEGRGVNPGDTRIWSVLRRGDPRSTKAGASTPATHLTAPVSVDE